MLKAPSTWDNLLLHKLHLICLLFLMQIGLGVQQQDAPLLAIVHILEKTLFLGVQRNNKQSLGQARKQNTVQWLIRQLSLHG